MMVFWDISLLLSLAVSIIIFITPAFASPPQYSRTNHSHNTNCRNTKIAVLGAGTAGIFAAQAISNASVSDFLIVEYNSEIGGRVRHTEFGKDPDGKPYTVELGANWVQGTVTEGGPENPIWTLATKYNIQNTLSNISVIESFTPKGRKDFLAKWRYFENAYETVEQDSGLILKNNLQDRSFRAGLNLAGYKPIRDPEAMAIEWLQMDFEYAQKPEVSSQEFTISNFVSPVSRSLNIPWMLTDRGQNTTYYGFSEDNLFVHDPRGYNVFIRGEAATFLKPNDSRLLLDTIVKEIKWGKEGVTIHNRDGSCIDADYAICTFSIGVLKAGEVAFTPALPRWKQIAIETFDIGIYTKIFLQFPPEKVFWDRTTQFLLYASPVRGYYPIFQPLGIPEFLPGSGILVATVVTDQSVIIEEQSDDETKAQVLEVLRNMFGHDEVPEPIDFMYPRWGKTPWAHGSYSNWPPGLSLEGHQNLRANTERLWFAGEATSQEYYGYLQGAFFEGRRAGQKVAACVNGKGDPKECSANTDGGEDGQKHYEVLEGTTSQEEYGSVNGWYVSSFQTIGDVGLEGGGG